MAAAHQQREPDRTAGSPRTYELVEPLPQPPALSGRVSLSQDFDRLIDAMAADLVIHGENCVRKFGDFHLALTGGDDPSPIYERLMYDPNYRRLPWRRTHLWLVDEQCVADPYSDEAAQFASIRETIVDHSDIPPEQVHPVVQQDGDAARAYEQQLKEVLGWREKGQDRLDYVLLSMDSAGCAAGLFPGSRALHESSNLVCRVNDPADDARPWVSMTASFINAARFIAVMAAGDDRADAVGQLAGAGEPDRQVMRAIDPIRGELKWYIDAAACPRMSD